jgi:hypothetical protein
MAVAQAPEGLDRTSVDAATSVRPVKLHGSRDHQNGDALRRLGCRTTCATTAEDQDIKWNKEAAATFA